MSLKILIKNETFRQIVRFILIGLVNTAFGFGAYTVLVLLGVSPQPALAVAFVMVVIWNYWTHGRFVFQSNGIRKLPFYALCYLGVYGFNSLSLEFALSHDIGPIISQAMITPFAATMSYFLIGRVLTGHFPIFGGKS